MSRDLSSVGRCVQKEEEHEHFLLAHMALQEAMLQNLLLVQCLLQARLVTTTLLRDSVIVVVVVVVTTFPP